MGAYTFPHRSAGTSYIWLRKSPPSLSCPEGPHKCVCVTPDKWSSAHNITEAIPRELATADVVWGGNNNLRPWRLSQD